MRGPALDELLQHTAALRRLARDLVGATNADDVLQDAAIEVMRAPPREPGPMLGWLRQVVRHVAGKRRRADAVRSRHEAAAAAAGERAFEVAGAATMDSLRQLTGWIAALPEPYRATLVARYVQELTPNAIAEASGVPVRTVKTRLQRGLQLLRERADHDGGDWRGAFVLAFGFEIRDVAAVATGVAGAVGMGMTAKAMVAMGAMALVAFAVWQWSDPSGGAAQSPASSVPPSPAVAARVDAPAQPNVEAPAPERSPVATSASPAPPRRAGADEIVVHVVDAASGAPVTSFGVREHMSPQSPLGDPRPRPLLHAGDHPDGRVVMPASEFVDRGYVVEDTAGAYLPSQWFAAGAAVERDGERTIELRLPKPIAVRVKVVRERSGEAIVGSRVELLRPWIVPHPVMPFTIAQPSSRFYAQPTDNALTMKLAGGRALLLGDAKTDAAGVAVLRVPSGEQLVLRLSGASHRTVVIEPWQAPSERDTEIVLTIAAGATVRGRLTPLSALAVMRADAPESPVDVQAQAAQVLRQTQTTGVRLQHESSGEFRPPGTILDRPVMLGDDGRFEMTGLAPGNWRMFFRYEIATRPGGGRRTAVPHVFELELPKLAALTDGELRVVDIDISEWVPGTLRAQVPRDERMGKEGALLLRQVASVGPPLLFNPSLNVYAAPGDPIDVSLPPARYLATWMRSNASNQPFVLGEFEVRSRAATVAELAIDADTVSIQVVEADGTTPAQGKLMLGCAGWVAGVDVDANGAATFDAMPHSFEVKATFRRWNAERPNGPFTTDAIDLGTIRGDGKPIVLRLPAR